CHEAGIKVVMITGDGSRTAVAIAREIGLIEGNPVVVEGHEFIKLSDEELREKLSQEQVIFARMTPKHKLRVVSILKEEGKIVAVTGDGVNDAPALKKADIGVAMGISGTDVAKEASDMILLDDNFATIVNAVEEGRAVYENIKKFITYIFASNIPEAVPYLAFILLRIPLPLTIIQILAVDLGTDMLPALALGAERPTPGVMKQPPRKLKERLLDLPLITRSYLFLGPIEAIACMFGFFWVLYAGGWTWGVMLPPTDTLYLQATTACLTAIIVTQIANVFACRSFKESTFRLGIFTNRLIFGGIAFELLLQLFIVYHPFGNKIFSTAPIPLTVWLILIPFAVFLFFAEEARKLMVRQKLSASTLQGRS
ncbi:MAG: cation-transporting P-type ATPase, partial [Nitrospira sp.]|nr:cation-transporting P-type ATPase [Nitrospira sp.]